MARETRRTLAQAIRRGLAPRLVGRRFAAVISSGEALRQQSPVAELTTWLPGRRLTVLKRRGKYLLFVLEGGGALLGHLGMTGRLLVGPHADLDTLPHVHLKFAFEDGQEMIFQDVRRFGQALVFPPGVPITPLQQVGREPFSRTVTAAWLAQKARGRARPLKNFLLDGRILAGIGNIYACEIMFAANLHPETPAGRLSRHDWERVLKETRRILAQAIRRGGTTVNDYLNSHGETGLFQLGLMVYGRVGEPCRVCGIEIQRLVQAGRSTFFCPACEFRDTATKIHQGMQFDSTFGFSKVCPREKIHTQIYGSGVQSIDGLFQVYTQWFVGVKHLGSVDQQVSKVGIDAPVPCFVCVSEIVF